MRKEKKNRKRFPVLTNLRKTIPRLRLLRGIKTTVVISSRVAKRKRRDKENVSAIELLGSSFKCRDITILQSMSPLECSQRYDRE